MATEDVRVTNWPQNGSKEQVALSLFDRLRYTYERQGSLQGDLDLFAQCLRAAGGHTYDISKLT